MTEMEKMKAGLEYCFTDKELIARKSLAIVRCEEYNAIDVLTAPLTPSPRT